jgi:hypothetical protein
MNRARLTALFACLFWCAQGFAANAIIEEAGQLEMRGHFQEAGQKLSMALTNTSLLPAERKELEFELDRLERIKKDFPFTKEELFSETKKSVKGLTREEYERWIQEGRFDSREIDGQRLFMVVSVSNLFWRYPELAARRRPPKNTATVEKRHLETCRAIKQAALSEHKPYVLPKRFEVTMSVTAGANVSPDGELLRAWLPIPREYPFQGDFDLLSSSAEVKHTDPEDNAIRSIYLEKKAKTNKPTEFKIQYAYTAQGVWFEIKPDQVKPIDSRDPRLQEFTREAPHIVFSPEMRALSQQIAGSETNPYLKAKRFYDWIAENIKYSFAIEYSTIRNIGDYCRTKGYGDCGQEAFLFMTLCRLNDIPARWQSGWNTFPGAKSNHDWTEIYLAPFGWIPVDPYMGIYAMRYANHLSAEQKHELRDFYFGGLDQYRMSANGDHNQPLDPPKQSMRSDNVDFQRGELEWGNHNIYFDKFSYDLTMKEIKLARGRID